MKLRTLIIDDEPIALEKLRSYVEKVPFLEPAAECQSAFQAMEYLATDSVDLIVTDINMPDLDGLEFIRGLNNRPMVIFITAHPQYAVDSYKVSAVDYLLKPYSFSDFHRAVSKAYEQYRSRREAQPEPTSAAKDSIFIKTDYRYVRVATSDIRYIKGYGEYLQIFVQGATTPLLTLSSFASIRERLPESFLQVHRSYIVNMNHVQQIERNRLILDSDTYIPVSESYRAAFQHYLASHAIGRGK